MMVANEKGEGAGLGNMGTYKDQTGPGGGGQPGLSWACEWGRCLG